ncbi:hypothetical protein [Actinomadura harenae]|uniref:hypothetical protein n=1 Tax=Actinomadura harenae TaxID=2483351 RepID=UPI000EFB1E3E|nr:hypothetical protein [Actinomadura harenae]
MGRVGADGTFVRGVVADLVLGDAPSKDEFEEVDELGVLGGLVREVRSAPPLDRALLEVVDEGAYAGGGVGALGGVNEVGAAGVAGRKAPAWPSLDGEGDSVGVGVDGGFGGGVGFGGAGAGVPDSGRARGVVG